MQRSLDGHSHLLPTQPHPADLTVPWWIVGVLTLAFVALGLITAGQNTLAIDLSVTGWIQSLDGRTARFLGWIGDHLGGTKTALTGVAAGFFAAALLRSERDAWFLGIATICRLLATSLKGVFDSPRPTLAQVEQSRLFDSTGFPSGHATTATLLLGTLAFMVARRSGQPWVRFALLALWVCGAFTTGFARIWHGAHWFTDTVGGAMIGLIIVIVAANLSATITAARSSGRRRRRSQRPA